jgi:hypothetical protein
MIRTALAAALGIAASALLPTASVHAQNARSFVSGHGLDTNPCTLAAPCRSFQRAHDQTNSGGEVDVLDPAGYGALTITKAISIINDGIGTSSVLVPSGGAGIAINAGLGDAVTLRGLTIEGAGVGHNGVQFATGKSLDIDNCVIHNLTNRGIEFAPAGTTSDLAVSNTLVSNNGVRGIIILPSGGFTARAVLDHLRVTHNPTAGITVNNGGQSGIAHVIVRDSIISNNGMGISTLANSLPLVQFTNFLSVVNSAIADNDTGLSANGTFAGITLAKSMITGNVTSWTVSNGGSLASARDGDPAPPTYNLK